MRQERDWSATEAHEHLHKGLGLKPKSRASYVAIEDGRPLRPLEERYLREEFGGGPDPILDRDPMAGSDNRLRDQSDPADLQPLYDRIDALVAELQADRAIIAALIGLPEAPTAERWAEFRRWTEANRPQPDPAPAAR